MNEMTLSSRHRIRNSSPGGLRPSTLPLGHAGSPQYWIFTSEWGRKFEGILRETNTKIQPDAGLTLAQRLQRWPNISPTSSQCLMFNGDQLNQGKVPITYIQFINNHSHHNYSQKRQILSVLINCSVIAGRFKCRDMFYIISMYVI